MIVTRFVKKHIIYVQESHYSVHFKKIVDLYYRNWNNKKYALLNHHHQSIKFKIKLLSQNIFVKSWIINTEDLNLNFERNLFMNSIIIAFFLNWADIINNKSLLYKNCYWLYHLSQDTEEISKKYNRVFNEKRFSKNQINDEIVIIKLR